LIFPDGAVQVTVSIKIDTERHRDAADVNAIERIRCTRLGGAGSTKNRRIHGTSILIELNLAVFVTDHAALDPQTVEVGAERGLYNKKEKG